MDAMLKSLGRLFDPGRSDTLFLVVCSLCACSYSAPPPWCAWMVGATVLDPLSLYVGHGC